MDGLSGRCAIDVEDEVGNGVVCGISCIDMFDIPEGVFALLYCLGRARIFSID